MTSSSAATGDQPRRMPAFGSIIDLTAQLPPPPDHVERLALAAAEFSSTVPFADLPLPLEIRRAIDDLGFERTTPIQSVCLPEALRGRDILGQAQTGTGKTATFLITVFKELLETPRRHPTAPRAIVVAPTRELALQITEDAESLSRWTDLNTVAVFGGMDWEKQARKLGEPVDLLVATPGRLMDYAKRGMVSLGNIQVAVIDEADRMFDMGFILDVKWILGQCPADRQTLLFSATFPFEVTRLAQRFQRNPLEVRIQPEQIAATTIEQILYHVAEFEKLQLLLGLLDMHKPKRCLVFINTKRTGDWLNFKLWNNGWESGYISGDLPQRKRMKLVEDFREGKVEVMVATDVAARGLHIDDIELVVNFELPTDANDYVHRIGRTGRAGHAGRAISLADERLVQHLPEIERLLGHQITARVPEDDQFLRDQAPSYREVVLSQRPREARGGSRDGRGGKRKVEVWSPPTRRDDDAGSSDETSSRPARGAGVKAAAAPAVAPAIGADGTAAAPSKRKRRRGNGPRTGEAAATGETDAAAKATEGGAWRDDDDGDSDGGDEGTEASGGESDATGGTEDGTGAQRKRRRRGGRRRNRRPGEAGASGESGGAEAGGAETGGSADSSGGGDDA